MPDRELKSDLFDQFARIGKALASGRRIEIVDILANGERTVEAIAGQVGMSVANTSQHLQVLHEAGLVARRRQGASVRYSLASPRVYEYWASLRALAAERLAAVDRLARAYVGPAGGVEPVTREDLLRRIKNGERVVILDVRPSEEYEAGHLPGAISIPLDELERRLAELPRRADVVAYCRGPYCAFAPEAVRALRARGYRARVMEEGLPEWAAAGLPVEDASG
jgi:rhodanese-related sulfurtransferase/DNA-binding transcriptional ArsR family regulator